MYGFGRIGRLVARELMLKNGKGSQLRLRAIVTRREITPQVLEKRAAMLRNDSVHGEFSGTVEVHSKDQALIINGTTVYVISSETPENIDYTLYGIDKALIIDNTGAFRAKDALQRHLIAKGTAKVLLTAPGQGIPNIVYGVNQTEYTPKNYNICSAASCTTNAITPILKVVDTFEESIRGSDGFGSSGNK